MSQTSIPPRRADEEPPPDPGAESLASEAPGPFCGALGRRPEGYTVRRQPLSVIHAGLPVVLLWMPMAWAYSMSWRFFQSMDFLVFFFILIALAPYTAAVLNLVARLLQDTRAVVEGLSSAIEDHAPHQRGRSGELVTFMLRLQVSNIRRRARVIAWLAATSLLALWCVPPLMAEPRPGNPWPWFVLEGEQTGLRWVLCLAHLGVMVWLAVATYHTRQVRLAAGQSIRDPALIF